MHFTATTTTSKTAALVLLLLVGAAVSPVSARSFSEQIACLANAERTSSGLSPLVVNDKLTAAAQAHADDMARTNNMDHTGSDGSSPGDRVQKYGYNYMETAENIAYGQKNAQEVMRVWMDSPGHRENILNPQYKAIGAAESVNGGTPYYAQEFGSGDQSGGTVPKCDGAYNESTTPKQVTSYSGNGGGGGGGGGRRKSRTTYGGGSNGGGGGGGQKYGDDQSSQEYENGHAPQQHQQPSYGGRSRHGRQYSGNGNSRYGDNDSNSYGDGNNFFSAARDWFSRRGFGGGWPFGGGRHSGGRRSQGYEAGGDGMGDMMNHMGGGGYDGGYQPLAAY